MFPSTSCLLLDYHVKQYIHKHYLYSKSRSSDYSYLLIKKVSTITWWKATIYNSTRFAQFLQFTTQEVDMRFTEAYNTVAILYGTNVYHSFFHILYRCEPFISRKGYLIETKLLSQVNGVIELHSSIAS